MKDYITFKTILKVYSSLKNDIYSSVQERVLEMKFTFFGIIIFGYLQISTILVTPKVEVLDSPIQLSQKDIDDALITLAATPSMPILGGFGQPELSSHDFQCSIRGNIGHIAYYCNNSPLESTIKCFCCDESGHKANQYSQKGNSPTLVGTPRTVTPTFIFNIYCSS